jgi:hypothetical protein
MVYLVYNVTNHFINGIYEDEEQADEASRILEGFEVKEVPFYKKENSKFTYAVEDSNIDEEYYLNRIKMLENELERSNDKTLPHYILYNILVAFIFINVVVVLSTM